ncbi:MAG: 4-phosphoerythronate dehydrogenase PdxB [Thalassolituus sp.]|uniref:Erythronate-4-phosphate dehydrogenase n=2 Tax=root TaxID=1 RepID=M5DT20_9GAMM|nr:4-phosphoerythronate dehydrogenase PdxB [Thalassolituus oleivorans]MBL4832435.1 4-phosphoerythronate dehydrogenase PdxB [Pseudomonas sp.]PHQ87132.1 MAG: 4-phosphoerythronate dehydrogenase PdxB [Thalassobium sp.]APR66978.1 erythronate-4-phosphate dehydrogenase [Thalassolituus oleivorans]MDF1642447.1 4-phosphoerythronate dehydrogenase PdxB [Thalassolituus oleivorans]CCU72362.1 Erythronate-4-phosphate dehydrogenase [Thalassolituus oleivorans MIL-1]
MQIVADENIPLLDQFFSEFGDIVRVPGRTMTAADVADADILIVRSVTQVNEQLLAGSKVKFVGTATIGTDHIDLDYLEKAGIGFRSAPGCNAQAVVDYVLSALSVLVDSRGIAFTELSVGIVGLGNVGLLLRNRLEEMDVEVIGVDPFKDPEDVGVLSSFEEALSADVVTFHTPMTKSGDHPTWHMLNAETLAKMKPDACLINAARGAVVDNAALLEHLKANDDFSAILDVWEGEPEINTELLDYCWLGTPHIAGYSLDGKMRGTEMVYHGVCEFFGLPIRCKLAQFLPEPGIKRVNFTEQAPVHQALRTAIRAAYEIRVDDGVLRSAMRRSKNLRETFDRLRKEYPLRRDTPTLRVGVPARAHDLMDALTSAGFDVRTK